MFFVLITYLLLYKLLYKLKTVDNSKLYQDYINITIKFYKFYNNLLNSLNINHE